MIIIVNKTRLSLDTNTVINYASLVQGCPVRALGDA